MGAKGRWGMKKKITRQNMQEERAEGEARNGGENYEKEMIE